MSSSIRCQTNTDTTKLSSKISSFGESLSPFSLDSTTTKSNPIDSLSLKSDILSKNKLSKIDTIDIKSALKKQLPSVEKKAIPNKDSIVGKINVEKNKLKTKIKDELIVKKKDFTLHGALSNQFDYGVVPYYVANATSPMGIFKSQGDLNFSLKKLPLIFNYFYSNPASLMGIQNYYTLKFDAEAYQKNIENECVEKKSSYIEKLKEVEKLKQELSQKLAFCEAMQSYTNTTNQLNNYQVDSSISKKNYSNIPVAYTGIDSSKYTTTDSSKLNTVKAKGLSKTDSIKQLESRYMDSLINNFSADSNYQKIKTYKSKIELYEKQIQEYKQAVNVLDSKNISDINNPYLSKGENLLSKIKRFEIGLCYPNYSTFLINNLTLKGINVGYGTKTYFINATYGKTVNNLQNQQNINNNITSAFQNYSNFFDFSKNQDARKILAGKVGIGNFNQSYIAVGALYGVGRQAYSQYSGNDEKNTVYELDGKIIYKGYTLYGSFAKSILNNPNADQVIFSNNRNNAIQIRFSGQLPIIKTKFSLGYRLVDPFFKSFGVGFIRTDNINTFKDNFPKTVPTTHKVGVELIIQKKTPSRPKYECFVSGTKITMNDGTTKSIEKLVIGDKILSVNLETMKIEDDEILEMVSPIHDEIVVLSFSDKTINSNTFDHPYYVESKGWCSYKPAQTKLKYELVVRQLEIGDKCYKYMDNKLVLVELKSMIEELGDVKTYNIASLKRNNVYFANSILVNNEKKTSRFTQEKIIDTLNCPINDGLYRYYINSSKETYLEGRVKNCNKDGVWHFYSSNSIRLLLEFKNGICYTEKTKSINSNTYLLSVQLNDTHDTLVLYDYNTKDLIESKKKYLIDKNNIPINASLSSENINFSKKLVYEMNIDYSPFASDLSIMSIKESDEQKHIITKYYRNYLSNQKTLIYEISGNNFIVGNKSSYYKLMKKELKYLKKEGER